MRLTSFRIVISPLRMLSTPEVASILSFFVGVRLDEFQYPDIESALCRFMFWIGLYGPLRP